LLPVPLDHADGLYSVDWTAAWSDGGRLSGAAGIRVARKTYPVQELTLDPKYVTPDPALKERVARESARMRAALGTASPDRFWDLPLARPVSGSLSSVFGLRRVLNGQPRGAHKGLDFRGRTGDPIRAVASGRVVLTGDFYYPGTFVVIDHGLGVLSISMHMSKRDAAAGQWVNRGDIIGRIGATGRVTGPHLHLGLSVLGQSVDILPLLEKGHDTWDPKDPAEDIRERP
jgi:murein DD-endopeptidase MepM/ murein hydrolase activator NlpD